MLPSVQSGFSFVTSTRSARRRSACRRSSHRRPLPCDADVGGGVPRPSGDVRSRRSRRSVSLHSLPAMQDAARDVVALALSLPPNRPAMAHTAIGAHPDRHDHRSRPEGALVSYLALSAHDRFRVQTEQPTGKFRNRGPSVVLGAVEIEQTISITAPPAKVWAALIDVEKCPTWTKSMEAVKRVDSGPFGMGSEVRIKQPKLPETVWKVVDFEPGTYFAWHAAARGVSTIAGHRVTASDGGCTVTLSIKQSGPMSWLAGLLYGKMSRAYVDMEANGLKSYCEAP